MSRITRVGEETSVRIDDGDGAGVYGFEVGAAVHAGESLHAWGSVERVPGLPRNLLGRGRPALRRNRFVLAAVDLEHRVELGELEELLNSLARVDEDQLAVLGRELAEVANELADAGRGDVVDL